MPYLDTATSVISPAAKPYQENPKSLTFYRDLLEPFGVELDEDLLRSGTQISHRDLVDHLLADLPAGYAESRDADLVVLAHALPDVLPFAVNASHVNMVFGGGAESIGISEQGLAAPFTALRIISAYQRGGRSERAVLLALETTTLPSPDPFVRDSGLVDSGAMFVLDHTGGFGVDTVESFPSAQALTDRLRELADEATLFVTGPGGAGAEAGVKVHEAPAGRYCTSVWLELAQHWQTWQQDYATVVLSDVDRRDGRGHLAVFRTGRP